MNRMSTSSPLAFLLELATEKLLGSLAICHEAIFFIKKKTDTLI